jgi:probable O-glycosylation ligase (exosortase A-associated)
MSTIESYDQDDSFMGRVVAWKMNYAIASERPLVGGGFYACNVDWVAQKFSHGELGRGMAAHSIYFEVLGDHGFVGLGLYFAIVGAAWLNTWIVLSFVGRRADLAWAGELARMLQLSQVAFLVGGSALSMAYYDGELVLLALTAALLQVVRSPAGTELKAASKWRVVVRSAPAPVSARRKAGGALSFDRNARPSRP